MVEYVELDNTLFIINSSRWSKAKRSGDCSHFIGFCCAGHMSLRVSPEPLIATGTNLIFQRFAAVKHHPKSGLKRNAADSWGAVEF